VFGYATDETPEYMPLPIVLTHKLCWSLARARKDGALPYLRPDGKAQVVVQYSDGRPRRVACVVLHAQHDLGVERGHIVRDLTDCVVRKAIPAALLDSETEYYINSSGQFVSGGPAFDTGMTGRKLMADTYGGACPHGGGAFSGKDPTKVDRSGAYMARYVAKNIVAASLAGRCTVEISYTTGKTEPLSLRIDLHGTGAIDEWRLERIVPRVFSLNPTGIIETLDLRRPVYQQTAAYGHFGRELPAFTWERTDLTAILRHHAGAKGGKDNDNGCQSTRGNLHSG